ncbi:hypothetical protein ACF09E_13090 [Streptomyces sp. NPDC014891]|uniref:hypothetical protein n=1 Tax=Streptomyces sp. NPDC014891 TaxID=3364929 RepID=UPI0036F660B2
MFTSRSASSAAPAVPSAPASVRMRRARGLAVAVLLLGALSVSCGASDPKDDGAAAGSGVSATPSAAATQGATPTPAPSEGGGTDVPETGEATPSPTESEPVSLVRDAFAGLQATLNDSCTPSNCAYFLGRVYDELHRLNRAMKADPKGPGHFPEPIQHIAKLDEELGGDRSFENLKKHQPLLLGTRDKINTWMQGHPDDYR